MMMDSGRDPRGGIFSMFRVDCSLVVVLCLYNHYIYICICICQTNDNHVEVCISNGGGVTTLLEHLLPYHTLQM